MKDMVEIMEDGNMVNEQYYSKQVVLKYGIMEMPSPKLFFGDPVHSTLCY